MKREKVSQNKVPKHGVETNTDEQTNRRKQESKASTPDKAATHEGGNRRAGSKVGSRQQDYIGSNTSTHTTGESQRTPWVIGSSLG